MFFFSPAKNGVGSVILYKKKKKKKKIRVFLLRVDALLSYFAFLLIKIAESWV